MFSHNGFLKDSTNSELLKLVQIPRSLQFRKDAVENKTSLYSVIKSNLGKENDLKIIVSKYLYGGLDKEFRTTYYAASIYFTFNSLAIKGEIISKVLDRLILDSEKQRELYPKHASTKNIIKFDEFIRLEKYQRPQIRPISRLYRISDTNEVAVFISICTLPDLEQAEFCYFSNYDSFVGISSLKIRIIDSSDYDNYIADSIYEKDNILSEESGKVSEIAEAEKEVLPDDEADLSESTETEKEVLPDDEANLSELTEAEKEVLPDDEANLSESIGAEKEVLPDDEANLSESIEAEKEVPLDDKANFSESTETEKEVLLDDEANLSEPTEAETQVFPVDPTKISKQKKGEDGSISNLIPTYSNLIDDASEVNPDAIEEKSKETKRDLLSISGLLFIMFLSIAYFLIPEKNFKKKSADTSIGLTPQENEISAVAKSKKSDNDIISDIDPIGTINIVDSESDNPNNLDIKTILDHVRNYLKSREYDIDRNAHYYRYLSKAELKKEISPTELNQISVLKRKISNLQKAPQGTSMACFEGRDFLRISVDLNRKLSEKEIRFLTNQMKIDFSGNKIYITAQGFINFSSLSTAKNTGANCRSAHLEYIKWTRVEVYLPNLDIAHLKKEISYQLQENVLQVDIFFL